MDLQETFPLVIDLEYNEVRAEEASKNLTLRRIYCAQLDMEGI